jgi:hypothetical protein
VEIAKKFYMGAGILLLCSHFFLCQAQKFLRIEATYSVKEQLSDGTLSLQVGKVFFNRSNGIIFYKISHPEKNIVLATDTFMLTIDASGKKTGISGTGFVSLSVYNILLRGDLAYYGLDKMPYKMEEVHTEDTLVISTWIIRDDMEASISKIMLAQHDKQLYSLVGMDKQDHIVLKQFLKITR